MATDRTEAVYDEEMAPLVQRLIEIAKRERIPLLVSAAMVMPDGTAGGCLTALGFDDADPRLKGMQNRHGLSVGVMRGHSGFDTASGLVITRHHREEEPDDDR